MKKFKNLLTLILVCISVLACGVMFSGCTQKEDDNKLSTITIEEGIEKYKTIAKNYLKSDFIVTYGDFEDFFFKYDAEKKIGYYEESGWYEWYWQNEEYCYHATGTLDTYKYDIINWRELVIDEQLFGYVLNSEYEKNISISIVDAGKYYQIEAILNFEDESETDSVCVINFIFNNDHILRIEMSGDIEGGSVIITFNDGEVNLNLPENIKALESSAVEE